jgi:tetratricopeptide (TPR) repeat protein
MDKSTGLIASLKTEVRTHLAGNRLTEAEAAGKQLCQLAPDDIDNWVCLGEIQRVLRDFTGAEHCCRQVLTLRPEYAPAYHALGASLQQQGRLPDALVCYREAIRLDPAIAETHYFLANALREAGQFNEAAAAYRRVLELNPDHFECLNNLGILLTNLGDNQAALAYLQSALRQQPDHVVTLTNLGDALVALNRYDEAIQHLQHALRINPGFVNALCALANALHHSGNLHKALDTYAKLAALQPGSADAILGQARIQEQLGNHQECYRLVKPLLDSGNLAAVPVFFDVSKHVGKREEAAQQLEGMLESGGLRNDAAAAIHFKLGKYYDEIAEYESAFSHYKQANTLTPASFNRKQLERFVSDSIMVYSPSFVEDMPHAQHHSHLPVFIVGMPRSGTSLVEQILASHPGVHGAGELQHLSRIVRQLAAGYPGVTAPLFLRNLSQQELDVQAEQHLRTLAELGAGASRVTDKMPGNTHYVGLIRQLFPGTAIIHCTRHPLDTCLSCYFATFGNTGHDYIYDLQTVGEYYLQYHRLMQHWEAVFPQQILRVSYAQLVLDQETISRRMVEFCGLPWDDRCLSFHDNDRMVFTLSYDQVRQPIYTRSLERWRHYEKHLQPLRELLEAGGIDCA